MAQTELPPHVDPPSPVAQRIADRIRGRRDDLVARWEAAVRALPRARGLDPPVLVDHIPDLVERIAQAIEDVSHGRPPPPPGLDGCDLQQGLRELRVLRRCILHALSDPAPGPVELDELRALEDAVEDAIEDAIDAAIVEHMLRDQARRAADNARLYREAQTAIQVRDDVLAIVSHDLGNPLHAINLGTSLLFQHHGTDGRARKQIDAIRRSADRMERLINDLLDMASINAGKLAIQPAEVDARELASEVLDSHEPAAHDRGITIARDIDHADLVLRVDRDRIVQAFDNLLGNAIKFCAPGDVIAVHAGRVDGGVRFTFADTGPGIAASDLPHIFEPYWSSRSGRKKGTGLGLFITRAIIEAHGGTIRVDSSPGGGASFAVTLPIGDVGIAPATTDPYIP